MKLIDLTKSLDRKKGARVSYTTIYKNKNMFGIASSNGLKERITYKLQQTNELSGTHPEVML